MPSHIARFTISVIIMLVSQCVIRRSRILPCKHVACVTCCDREKSLRNGRSMKSGQLKSPRSIKSFLEQRCEHNRDISSQNILL